MEKTTRVEVTPPGSWNWRDGFKGLIMAVGTPVLYLLQEMIPGYNLDPYVQVALSAGVTYLIKNFFSTSIKEVK